MNRWFNWGAFLSAMIMLTLLYFCEIQPRDKAIARLEAEVDSLKKETIGYLFPNGLRVEDVRRADSLRIYRAMAFDEQYWGKIYRDKYERADLDLSICQLRVYALLDSLGWPKQWPPDTLKTTPMKRREK